jgi:methionine biosynthesis protein MetW
MPESTRDPYYESYWQPEAMRGRPSPRGPVLPAVDRLFRRYIRQGDRCLDVGCGDGRAGGLGLRPYGAEYVGVDISQTAIEAARARGLTALRIDDSASLPFPDDHFDAVICLEVLEHLWNPRATVNEIWRVLKPGSVLIATTPNVAYWRRRVDLALLGRWNPFGYNLAVEQPWGDPHIRFFNPGSLRRLLAMCAFDAIEVAGHRGTFLGDLPWVGRRLAVEEGSAVYQWFEHISPSFFGCFLNAVARKPARPA